MQKRGKQMRKSTFSFIEKLKMTREKYHWIRKKAVFSRKPIIQIGIFGESLFATGNILATEIPFEFLIGSDACFCLWLFFSSRL